MSIFAPLVAPPELACIVLPFLNGESNALEPGSASGGRWIVGRPAPLPQPLFEFFRAGRAAARADVFSATCQRAVKFPHLWAFNFP
jgi:hypothetical protein